MKRLFCMLLCFILVFTLFGCGSKEDENHVTFYYIRSEYDYGTEDGVIASELRDVSDKAADLRNLLALYLVGPLDESLSSPFPGTKLISLETRDDTLLIQLAGSASIMSEVRYSLACACMTMTCLELTDAAQVTITCSDRSVTMSRDNLVLFDIPAPIETTTEESQ